MSEPRTTADIMCDMLDFAAEHEWSDDIHAWGDYYEKGCRDCGATKDVKLKNTPCGEHAPGCARYRLFEEARAFLRAEQELAADVRPEASPAVQAALRGLERVAPTDHGDGDTCPSCTEVLGSPSVCAISHDFRPGAYDGATVTTTPGHVWQRDASGESELVPTPPPREAAPPHFAAWPMYDDGPEVKP